LLKQEQHAAMPPAGLLAWLIAFNEGLLDAVPLDQAQAVQASLVGLVLDSDLDANDPRERWVDFLRRHCAALAPTDDDAPRPPAAHAAEAAP
jgi:hypothetical protein